MFQEHNLPMQRSSNAIHKYGINIFVLIDLLSHHCGREHSCKLLEHSSMLLICLYI